METSNVYEKNNTLKNRLQSSLNMVNMSIIGPAEERELIDKTRSSHQI